MILAVNAAARGPRSGIPAASYRQNEGSTGPLVWVTGSAVARRTRWGRSIVRVTA
jgi:hypothetical protein